MAKEGKGRRRPSKSTWSLGAGTYSREFDTESWSQVQDKNFHLQLAQKEERRKSARAIPTDASQRLAYIRAYLCQPFKFQITTGFEAIMISAFFMNILIHVTLGLIPVIYIHTFLAAYNPDVHEFGVKMSPLCLGFAIQKLLGSFFQLVAWVDYMALCCKYIYAGITQQNPWTRCSSNWTYLPPIPQAFKCYTLMEFRKVIKNLTFSSNYTEENKDKHFSYKYNCYYNPSTNTIFSISHLTYFMKVFLELSTRHAAVNPQIELHIYYIIIWCIALCFYKSLFKRIPLKIIKPLNYVYLVFHLFTLIFIVLLDIGSSTKHVDFGTTKRYENLKGVTSNWNFNILIDILSVPPVVNMLVARSNDTPVPGRDTSITVAWAIVVWTLVPITYFKLYSHLAYKLKAPIFISPLDSYPYFWLWSIFFDTFYFGTIIGRFFFIFNLISDLSVFIVTFQLFVDVFVTEFKWVRGTFSIIVCFFGVLANLSQDYEDKMLLYFFTTTTNYVTELCIICYLYPFGRLMDDMHFFHGIPEPAWRKWLIAVTPLFFLYQIYTSFYALVVETHTVPALVEYQKTHINADFSLTKWAWWIALLPLAFGAVAKVIEHFFFKKRGFGRLCELLIPEPSWGPNEHVNRQIRKQFDSRRHVPSKCSRHLTRHLMSKSQQTAYELKVSYSGNKKRSAVIEAYHSEWDNVS